MDDVPGVEDAARIRLSETVILDSICSAVGAQASYLIALLLELKHLKQPTKGDTMSRLTDLSTT